MRRISAFWGVAGFTLILSFAIIRLFSKSVEAFGFSFAWYHWLVFAINIVFMAYSEGYKGFQIAYSPRLAARARYLRDHAAPIQALLAPFFCMGYFDAPKRRRIAALILTVAIIILIIIFQFLPQPWRGILDAGVVVGLSWGMIATLVFSFKALSSKSFYHDPEVPGYEVNHK